MAVTALRLEGFESSVRARAEGLALRLKPYGRIDRLEGPHSRDFWRHIGEVEVFAREARPLWRVSVPPAAGWRIGEAVGEALYDWGGGLVWTPWEDSGAIRAAARAAGGHATLWRGEADAPAFEPLEDPLLALSREVKAAFDPHGVLNPGRLIPEGR